MLVGAVCIRRKGLSHSRELCELKDKSRQYFWSVCPDKKGDVNACINTTVQKLGVGKIFVFLCFERILFAHQGCIYGI